MTDSIVANKCPKKKRRKKMKVDGNSAYVEKLLLVLTYRLPSMVSKSTVNPD